MKPEAKYIAHGITGPEYFTGLLKDLECLRIVIELKHKIQIAIRMLGTVEAREVN